MSSGLGPVLKPHMPLSLISSGVSEMSQKLSVTQLAETQIRHPLTGKIMNNILKIV